ncbi:queuosine biosynthesis protein QueD [Desulfotomaculum nigrificans CO-1-SRB]|uniref:6-carboxy-5,6,7,8-tetrahydropterin synthase n=1 Tax=Desulfotomaculum nigrificans (strain DSM 14880 / VKM B-2319 / CO-1-SRB) TaxID=868595 RepID=F6B4U2_DESCC|nr:6-carboxytetrahydropterin synthase QueD [Desulfotomaculum nigrificans]AEF94204.1 queuosine biosynthesis protein QueD [Desulfotomaculum nigrificans CO-1-SRB]
MYQLTVNSKFSAAHSLCGYPGDCARLHGHTWNVQVKVKGNNLDHLGMLVDFKAIKKLLAEVVDQLDHSFLNEIPGFGQDGMNPTAENLAYYIYKKLKNPIAGIREGVTLQEISVWESPDAYATYREE